MNERKMTQELYDDSLTGRIKNIREGVKEARKTKKDLKDVFGNRAVLDNLLFGGIEQDLGIQDLNPDVIAERVRDALKDGTSQEEIDKITEFISENMRDMAEYHAEKSYGGFAAYGGFRKPYEDIKDDLNFVNFNQLNELGLSTAWNYAMYSGTKLVYDTLKIDEKIQKGGIFSSLVGGFIKSKLFQYREGYSKNLPKMFPIIDVWQRFYEGSSTIGELYTVEIDGYELPVYMRDIEEKKPEPDEKMLKGAIKTIAEKGVSPYNTIESLDDFYNSNFSTLAAVKYTRGDFQSDMLEDPRKFREWIIKDDTWLIQQKGDIKNTKDVTLDNGKKVNINVYGRPSGLNMWLYWFAGDKIYDFIDAPIDPIQKIMETYSRDAGQLFLKEEYKMIAGIRRNFFCSGRKKLLYDVTDLPAGMAPDVTAYR